MGYELNGTEERRPSRGWLILLCLIYGAIEIVAVAWLTEMVHNSLAVGWTLAYLVAINLVAFAFYVYDKLFAILLGNVLPFRVPVPLLVWGLAFPGGWAGAVAAMALADHKTSADADATAFRLKLVAAYAVTVTLLLALRHVRATWPPISLEQLDSVVEKFVTLVISAVRAAFDTVRSRY